MARIEVLGPIRAARDGARVDLGGPTQRRLLAGLVARRGETVSVLTLLEDLWGDEPPPSGQQSIQAYVSRLRRALGSEAIETSAPGYRLGKDVETDAEDFVERLGSLPETQTDRQEAIEAALSLWDGPPYEGFDHVDFAAHRLNELRLGVEEELARLRANSGDVAGAVSILERLIASQPLREPTWLTLARVLARSGRQAEAIRVLDRYQLRLAEIGLEPGPDFAKAQDEVFEAPQRSSASPLPRVETNFMGRDEELSELSGLLDSHRLVTITGPGGMGKSRLAIEGLSRRRDLPIGVVRLAGLRADDEVGPAILNALGGEARGDPIEAIVTRLARSPMLLLFDNAEHVIDGVANAATAVMNRTQSRVLATSREPMNVVGEVILTLGSLDPEAARDLYRDRAKRVNPGFDAPTATLDELCEQLDHMPLAIEMAAARSLALTPDEILARLGRRFGLFSKPLRGGTGRHRTLDALVEWSYDLLDETERRVFERLGVIVGPFDIEMAAAVAGFGDVRPEGVAGTVASLVDKSLVSRTQRGGLRMLRVLKSYAVERLMAQHDEDAARSAHADWFAALAARIGVGLTSSAETFWIEIANSSIDDIGAALNWAVEHGDLDAAQTLLEGLFDWLYHRHPPAVLDWGELVLDRAGSHDAKSVSGAWAAVSAVKRGDLDRAHSLALSGTSVDGPASRFAWFMVGDVSCYLDRLKEAQDAFRKQMVRASNVNDVIGMIDGIAGETIALSFQGRFEQATELASDLEARARTLEAPTYRAFATYAMAEAIILSEPNRSEQLLEDAAVLAASVNNQYIEAMARTTRGSVLARLERFDEAFDDLRRAAELWEGLVVPRYGWVIVQYLGAVHAQVGSEELGTMLLASAAEAGRSRFSAGQQHWLTTVDRLAGRPEYPEWTARGRQLGLDDAMELALDAIPQRR